MYILQYAGVVKVYNISITRVLLVKLNIDDMPLRERIKFS